MKNLRLFIWIKRSGSKAEGIFIFLLCVLILFSSGCLKRIPYNQNQLEGFHLRQENVQLEFHTDKGKQIAFYIPPLERPQAPPAGLAILYPGIESVALGWLNFIKLEDDKNTGYLLIDYPGRGLSEGMMHPEENYKNTEGALQALADHFGIKKISSELYLMGHSFGTGAALQFAARHKVARVVLVAPFTTLRKAVAQKSFLLSILMMAQVDNIKLLQSILADSNPYETKVVIIHGTADKSLPFAMGEELAAINPKKILFFEIMDGDHTGILTSHRDLIFHATLGIP